MEERREGERKGRKGGGREGERKGKRRREEGRGRGGKERREREDGKGKRRREEETGGEGGREDGKGKRRREGREKPVDSSPHLPSASSTTGNNMPTTIRKQLKMMGPTNTYWHLPQ